VHLGALLWYNDNMKFGDLKSGDLLVYDVCGEIDATWLICGNGSALITSKHDTQMHSIRHLSLHHVVDKMAPHTEIQVTREGRIVFAGMSPQS